MFIFFERGMKSKCSYVYKTYSKADNKYLQSYDLKQESKHIIERGANNLYRYAMSKFLQTCGFK